MSASDDFQLLSLGLESPVVHAVEVVPDDDAELPQVTRAVYVGGDGDLAVTMKGGENVVLRNVGPGWHPIRVRRVRATGTTATGIVGGW